MDVMKALVETNTYLRKRITRRRMLRRSAMESSIFEGAHGLRSDKKNKPSATPKTAKKKNVPV